MYIIKTLTHNGLKVQNTILAAMPALFPLFRGNWNTLPSHQASPPNEAFKNKIHS